MTYQHYTSAELRNELDMQKSVVKNLEQRLATFMKSDAQYSKMNATLHERNLMLAEGHTELAEQNRNLVAEVQRLEEQVKNARFVMAELEAAMNCYVPAKDKDMPAVRVAEATLRHYRKAYHESTKLDRPYGEEMDGHDPGDEHHE